MSEPVEAPPARPPAMTADGVERPLDERYLSLATTVLWIIAACVWGTLTVGVPIFLIAARLPTWANTLILAAALGVAAAVGWFSRVWPGLEFRHAAYRVGPEGIEIRRGVLWRHVITVPRSRIQHTDVSQGPIERRYGLGTLTLFTAGSEHERVDLSGLDHERALAIRDALVPPVHGDAV